MRSTENVRGEWDELGERDARVVLPGPGSGGVPGEVPGVFVTEVPGAAAPGPVETTGPDAVPVPESERPRPAAAPSAAQPAEEPYAGEPYAEELSAEAYPPREPFPGEVLAAEALTGEMPVRALPGDPPREDTFRAQVSQEDGQSAGGLPTDAVREDADPAEELSTEVSRVGEQPVGAPRKGVFQEDASPAYALRTEAARTEVPLPDVPPAYATPAEVPRAEEPVPDGDRVDAVGTGAVRVEVAREEAEDIPPDLGPALDAVAEVGRAAVPVGDFPLVSLDETPGAVVDGRSEDDVPAGRMSEPGGPGLRTRLPAGEERAPVTIGVGAADPVAWWGAGRRQPVITTETTAPIPVHLLFRDEDRGGDGTGGSTARGGAVPLTGTAFTRRPGARRPPLPRSPQAETSTRPAPLADPRLAERPGPVLPGWVALLTAALGTAAGLAALAWQGVLPAAVTARLGLGTRPYEGIGIGTWALFALLVTLVLFALGGLGRGRAGHASVLTLFGEYRGSVRRTGLLWISPLLLRRRVDVRLRHWRSDPLPAVDANGTALRAVVLVVWRVKDTARATLGVADHECYLRDQVEAALARVLSQLPADAFHEDTHTLRDAEAVGNALTRMLKADCVPVGIEVYSAQPTAIEYAPEVAAAMQRCRVAALDAKHRDGVLSSVVDAVDDTVGRLTARGIVELDAYEHKALVRDLTVAFYTGRSGGEGA
ncbi:SPFH domain-containing protein [Streptomyces argenteolus]|uniref:SPFH domain-containing protein n=1 Tax=Streptomyces argenteolus TaxID=67274 RepID=A0ABW6X1W7_9ACTN